MADKKDIRKLSLDQIKSEIEKFGEKAFKAKQIYEWLWLKSAFSFDEMTNLSLSLRDSLKENFVINNVTVDEQQISNDSTIKSKFKLHDDNFVEGVLIPADDRMTACVSSQIGCSLSCKFCATGYMDRIRNLDAAEIYDQVVIINQQAEENYGHHLSNIVFMGMGEPLLNYANVLAGIEKITSDKGLGMSPKRITVSTAGIAKMIIKLADDDVKFNLALSLHAANDEKRNKIMPINESNTLEALADALKYFHKKTGTRVTYEYIVFNDFYDTLDDAEDLYQFAQHVPCKVNIIVYNPISFSDFVNTEKDKLDLFKDYLEDKGVIVNIRRSRGKDIDAACGQLVVKK